MPVLADQDLSDRGATRNHANRRLALILGLVALAFYALFLIVGA